MPGGTSSQTGLEIFSQQTDALGMTSFPVDLAAAGAPEEQAMI